jgi:hypothetical protein
VDDELAAVAARWRIEPEHDLLKDERTAVNR